jgi:hypothetical protein
MRAGASVRRSHPVSPLAGGLIAGYMYEKPSLPRQHCAAPRPEQLAGITSMPPDACPREIPTGLAVRESEILRRDKAARGCSLPGAVQERKRDQ